MASKSTLLGAAAEHLIVCELLRRGFIAGLSPVGVPNADVVVTDIEGTRLCSIQVKARREIGSDGGWHMKKKHEGIEGERHFYCFVDFGKTLDSQPGIYIVPSRVVAEVLRRSHQDWLSKPGARGQQRKDGDFRRFLPDYTRDFGPDSPYSRGWLEKYKNAWSVLELEPRPVTETLSQ